MAHYFRNVVFSSIFTTLSLSTTAATTASDVEGFDCIITPSQTVELGSPASGLLHSVLVDRSDPVNNGQVVARLDSRLEEANLAIARFKARSDSGLGLRKAALDIDRRTEKRISTLAESHMVSEQDLDKAVRDARLSNWRRKIARDDLQLQALEKARAETALERREIRSPIDGVVVARLHNPGEYIEDQPLMRIVRLDPLYVEAILPIRLFGKIKAGMQSSVWPEHEADLRLQGEVQLVDPIGDAASGTFGVRMTIANPDHAIPAGLKCRVQILPEVNSHAGQMGSAPGGPQIVDQQLAMPR